MKKQKAVELDHANSDLYVDRTALKSGQLVRIRQGCMAGLEGTLIELRGPKRVLVRIALGVFVEIDPKNIEATEVG